MFLADSFTPTTYGVAQRHSTVHQHYLSLKASPLEAFESTSTNVAATTLDPTTFLSDLLGSFLNSNLILAVPIVAALSLAALIGFGIVAYASPAEPEDD